MGTQQNSISLQDTLQGYQEWLEIRIQKMQSLLQEISSNSSLLHEARGLERCIEEMKNIVAKLENALRDPHFIQKMQRAPGYKEEINALPTRLQEIKAEQASWFQTVKNKPESIYKTPQSQDIQRTIRLLQEAQNRNDPLLQLVQKNLRAHQDRPTWLQSMLGIQNLLELVAGSAALFSGSEEEE